MSHYFESPSGTPPHDEECRFVPLDIRGEEVRLATAPGVFSGSRIDPGTEVLLRGMPDPPPSGQFLDIGCGYGPISLTLAANAPAATVWAIDVNDRALDLCRKNADRIGLRNVRTCRPEEVPDEIRFDFICYNPAIRIGKSQLHAMLRHWFDRMAADGEAYLVVQRNLGADSLQRWLVAQGWSATRLSSRRGFRILYCRAQVS